MRIPPRPLSYGEIKELERARTNAERINKLKRPQYVNAPNGPFTRYRPVLAIGHDSSSSNAEIKQLQREDY